MSQFGRSFSLAVRVFVLAVAADGLAFAAEPTEIARSREGRTGVMPAHEEPNPGKGVDLVFDDAALAVLAELAGPAQCVSGQAAGLFACSGMDLQGFVSLGELRAEARSASNLWGFVDLDDGREYAVIGLNNGTAVVEVTDPAHPRVVDSVAGPDSIWREVKVFQSRNGKKGRHETYAYVVSEAPAAGLQILDLTKLPGSIRLLGTFRGFDTAHTVFIANVDPVFGAPIAGDPPPVLYVEGSNRGFLALDISNPRAPVITGSFTGSYVHDIWAGVLRGARATSCEIGSDPCEIVVDWGGDAVRILDFTLKSRPIIIGSLFYPGLGYAHSGWISSDGNYLFSFDELDELQSGENSSVRVLDITDPRNPYLAGVWNSSTRAIEHNGYVVGDRLYVSHYERGLTVLDVTRPTAPEELGFFDTFPAGDDAAFHGAWGVYPFLPSGTLLVSNIDGAGGLFVLQESAALAGAGTPVLETSSEPRSIGGLPITR